MKELFERQTRVLIEQFRFELRTVAEQYGSIQQTLHEHDLRFDRLESHFDTFEIRFGNLENRFEHLENRFDHLETRFDKLDKQIGTVLTDHEHRLKRIEQKS